MQGVLDHCQEMESFLFLSLLLIISEFMFSRLFDVLLATYILHTNTALDWVYIICVMSVKITKVAFYSCCMMIRWWKDRQYWLLRLIWWGQMHFHLWYYLVRCCWPIWENTEDDDEVTLSKNFKLHVNEIFFAVHWQGRLNEMNVSLIGVQSVLFGDILPLKVTWLQKRTQKRVFFEGHVFNLCEAFQPVMMIMIIK